jgi:hypothetical protein
MADKDDPPPKSDAAQARELEAAEASEPAAADLRKADAAEARKADAAEVRKARYHEVAYTAISEATVDNLLHFIALRDVVGSATARFYEAYSSRAELLEALQDDAADVVQATAGAATPETITRFMQLVVDLKEKRPEAVETLKQLARDEFDSYFTPGSPQASRDLLRNLMVFAARNDENARERMTRFYSGVTHDYSLLCGVLLEAIGRRPIDRLGSVEAFVTVLSAVYDGLGVLARIEGPERAREILGDTLIPLVVGLTRRIDVPEQDDAQLLFGTGTAETPGDTP